MSEQSEYSDYFDSVAKECDIRELSEHTLGAIFWDYQQKHIDELKANLKEIIGTMKNNHAYHGDDNSWKCNDEDCAGCLYERRYLKRVGDEDV